MTRTVLIAIPCRLITLNMDLGAADGASTLEELVLRAVAGGRPTVKSLAQLFELPSRLMLDVVHGLWSRGLVAVDFTTNALEAISTGFAATGSEVDEPTSVKVRTEKFLYDPVTATVMPYRRGMEKVEFGALAMPVTRGAEVSDIPQAALLRAVQEVVREQGLRNNVLKVSFANPLLSPPEAVQWKTVEVVLERDGTTNQIMVKPVMMPAGWNITAVHRFQSKIRELVRDRPENRFVQGLLNQEVPRAASPADLRTMMGELAKLAEGLNSVELKQLEERHRLLRARVMDVLTLVEDAERARCSVEYVTPGGGVKWVVRYLLEQAEHQVVLAVPRISYRVLSEALPLLEKVAEAGRRLVFLWGDRPSAVLEGKVKTALLDLRARFPQTVLLEQRSSRCTASAVVCDDRFAFIGSRSALSEESGAGVLVGAADGTTGPPECVLDVLQWAKRAYPAWEQARLIAALPSDFRANRMPPAKAESFLWQRLALPELDRDWEDDPVASRTRWSARWGRVFQELVRAVEDVHRGAPVARAVSDGMYVDLVGRTVAAAAERLAIIDDGAEAESCGSDFGQAVLDVIGRGAVVHVQHPPFPAGRRPAGKYEDVLRRVESARTLRRSRGKCRAVLRDHEFVVGSHGPTGNRSGLPTHGQPITELGLHVISTGLTATFAAEMGIPDWLGDEPDDTRDYLPPLPSLTAARIDEDPWTVLGDRRDAGAPVERLRSDAATLLAGDTDGGERRKQWACWLLYDAWRRHAFVEAALLAPLLGEPTLSSDLAALAVPLEHGPFGDKLYECAITIANGSPSSRLVALVGVVAEMLFHGADSGWQVYQLLSADGSGYLDDIPSTWRALVDEAATCFAATGAPLPLGDIDAWAGGQALLADLRHRKDELHAEVKVFERGENHFNFVSGQKIHRAMFLPGEAMADVLRLTRHGVDEEERTAIIKRLPRDARTYINELAAKRLRIATPIAWSNHLTYAKKVDRYLADARRLASEAKAEPHNLRPALTLAPGQRTFARFVEREWHRLRLERDTVGEPACHALDALLRRLGSLPVIGKEPDDEVGLHR